MACVYCDKGEKLNSFAIKICDMKACELYLNKEQSYPGRLILVLKKHAEELFELEAVEQAEFMEDLCRATKAMHELYSPEKINCGMYGDVVKHLHVHIVPKKPDGLDWNGVFQMNPRKTYLEEEEYAKIVANYKKALAV